MLCRPLDKPFGSIADLPDVRTLQTLNLMPLYIAKIGIPQVGGVKRRSVENRPAQVRGAKVRFPYVCILEVGTAQVALAKVPRVQGCVREVRGLEIAISSIHCIKVGTYQACPWQANTLQKRAGNVDPHQRNTVLIQFLQSFDPTATATLALRGVDDLPGLVMLLLQTVTRLAEIKDHRHQDREATQVLENF